MTEQERLEQLMKQLDRATAEAFLAYVAAMKAPEMVREIERLIAAGLVGEAIGIVESHIQRFASVVTSNYTKVGTSTVSHLEPTVKRLRPRVAITFNPAHPRAAAQMQRQTLGLISRIADDQRTSIRNALTEALAEGVGPRQASRAYRDAVGLTDSQRRAVNNYRAALERVALGDSDALNRGLRDRRFDGTVRRFAENNEPLSKDQIDRMVNAYERKYIKYRAENIARTETTRTINDANEEAFAQVTEQADIGDELIERTWQSTKDKRTRDSHRHMQVRVVRGLNTPFVTGAGNRAMRPGDPNLPAEDVIQCRCLVVHRILTADEVHTSLSTS